MVNPVPVQSNPLASATGTPTEDMYRWMQSVRASNTAVNSSLTTKAAKDQDWEQSFFVEYPEDKDYRLVLNAKSARTITGVTTRTTAGTCTLTVKINTTALGGSANSASTSEQSQSHASSNVVNAGDDIVLTVSSASSAEGLSVLISGTMTLA